MIQFFLIKAKTGGHRVIEVEMPANVQPQCYIAGPFITKSDCNEWLTECRARRVRRLIYLGAALVLGGAYVVSGT